MQFSITNSIIDNKWIFYGRYTLFRVIIANNFKIIIIIIQTIHWYFRKGSVIILIDVYIKIPHGLPVKGRWRQAYDIINTYISIITLDDPLPEDCPVYTTSVPETTTPHYRACSVEPCGNNGTCVDHLDGGYHCICLEGFKDKNCTTGKLSSDTVITGLVMLMTRCAPSHTLFALCLSWWLIVKRALGKKPLSQTHRIQPPPAGFKVFYFWVGFVL